MPEILYEFSLLIGILFFVCLAVFIYLLSSQIKTSLFNFRAALLWLPLPVFILLFVQFFMPTLVKKTEIFYPPGVVIAVDVSGSYQAGVHLGHEKILTATIEQIEKQYIAQGFKVDKFFHSTQAFSKPFNDISLDSSHARLTDIEAMLGWARDSLGQKNTRGIFLFSDGRHTVSDNLGGITSNIPVYPVVITPTRGGDVQLEKVEIKNDPTSPSSNSMVEVALRIPENRPEEIRLNFLQNGNSSTPVKLKLPAGDVSSLSEIEIIKTPMKGMPFSLNTLKGLAAFSKLENDPNPFNDSVGVDMQVNENLPEIGFLLPLSGLDERWLLNVIDGSGNYKSHFTKPGGLANGPKRLYQQIWISDKNFKKQKLKIDVLQSLKVPVIIYGGAGIPHKGLKTFKTFPLTAKIKIAPEQSDKFEISHFNLEDLVLSSLRLPVVRSDMPCLITAETGSAKGCILSQVTENVYYFTLVGFWEKFFNPSVSYRDKEQIKSIIEGIAQITPHDSTEVKWDIPDEIYAETPFQVKMQFQGKGGNDFDGELHISSSTDNVVYSMTQGEAGRYQSDKILLRQGHYDFTLFNQWGHPLKIEKSVRVYSKARQEMKRTGYHYSLLTALAEYSGGKVLKISADSTNILGILPELPSGQIREEGEIKSRLYNNKVLLVVVLLLLSVYWVARKKMSLE